LFDEAEQDEGTERRCMIEGVVSVMFFQDGEVRGGGAGRTDFGWGLKRCDKRWREAEIYVQGRIELVSK